MLTKVQPHLDMSGAEIRIGNAVFPSPFEAGLEFSAPARGPWNIVHTGMLVPQSHQIFACARGCLRGVILTAAEMNAMNRMSWVSLEENDLFSGKMEQDLVDGCVHILEQMKRKPKAVLLFVSCLHLFSGFDFTLVLEQLRERFPEIDFIECYMHPTMRKSGLTPDQMMRQQLFAPLKSLPENPKSVAIVGNDRPTDPESFLCKSLAGNGLGVRDITLCRDYEEYLRMGESSLMIATYPPAKAGAEHLSKRLNRKFFYYPLSYNYAENARNQRCFLELLGLPEVDPELQIRTAEEALKQLKDVIGNIAIEIDYTSTPRPLGLARLLLEHGFNVKRVYADVFIGEEKEDFEFLKNNYPELILTATVHVKMRFSGKGCRTEEPVLAIGQKAAYFSGTRHFVNIVAGGGAHGFEGIIRMCEWMIDAFKNEKDTKEVIKLKGLGCESCLL